MACFSEEKNKMRNYEESGNFFPLPVLGFVSALDFRFFLVFLELPGDRQSKK